MYNRSYLRDGEKAQPLSGLVALMGYPGSVSRTYMVGSQLFVAPEPKDHSISPGLHNTRHTCGTQMHMYTKHPYT